jgi:hypothetical protein
VPTAEQTTMKRTESARRAVKMNGADHCRAVATTSVDIHTANREGVMTMIMNGDAPEEENVPTARDRNPTWTAMSWRMKTTTTTTT